jgi:DNA invertase Pin-like site-specific DNA recombinase
MARRSRKTEVVQATPTQVITQNKTALYVRLSVIDGGKRDGDTLLNQQELLEQYVANRSDLIVKQVFVDNGESGVSFERPAWNDLMRECRTGNINCIVLKDLSRLGRNYIETGDYLERILPMLGVRLIAVNDGYDSINLSNNERLVTNLKNLVNDIYAKDISRKVIAAMRTKQQNGEFIGGFAAYGYLKDPANSKKIIINPETAPIVKRIFEMKASGLGNGAICQQLNNDGVPCPFRYRFLKGWSSVSQYETCIWIISTINVILRNPLYLGHMTQGKAHVALCEGKEKRVMKRDEWIIVENTHEPIVSQELYDQANAVFDENAAEYKKHRHNRDYENHLRSDLILYGVAFCADCGKALARRKAKGSTKRQPFWYYACKRHIDLHACSPKKINETDLYDAIYYAIRVQIQRFVDVTGILERLNRDNSYQSRLMRMDNEIGETEMELRRLATLRQAVYEDYASKLLTASEYQYAIEKYDAETEVKQHSLEACKKERAEYTKNTTQADKWLLAFSRFMDDKSLSLEMVQAFVERVEVSEMNKVSITFKFQDEYEEIMAAINETSEMAVVV